MKVILTNLYALISKDSVQIAAKCEPNWASTVAAGDLARLPPAWISHWYLLHLPTMENWRVLSKDASWSQPPQGNPSNGTGPLTKKDILIKISKNIPLHIQPNSFLNSITEQRQALPWLLTLHGQDWLTATPSKQRFWQSRELKLSW